jgi:uncharacterized membrane protein YeaQ/YmgE (transglycosylase-associated protein family)
MYLLAWIFIGVLVGWAAGRFLEGNGYGPLMDMDKVMGIGGAVAGGLLMRAAGFHGFGGTVVTSMVAAIGAALLTMVVGFANGRRIYARAS